MWCRAGAVRDHDTRHTRCVLPTIGLSAKYGCARQRVLLVIHRESLGQDEVRVQGGTSESDNGRFLITLRKAALLTMAPTSAVQPGTLLSICRRPSKSTWAAFFLGLLRRTRTCARPAIICYQLDLADPESLKQRL